MRIHTRATQLRNISRMIPSRARRRRRPDRPRASVMDLGDRGPEAERRLLAHLS